MKTIPINQIHPSPNPIRKTWDEGKMEELAQSIKERGVIVPIKVRPNGDGYEVVYGHRRVEAARRVNLWDMPAIVEGVDDTEALIQALIENVQREDMTAYDKGVAIEELQTLKGWSIREMSRRGIATQANLLLWVNYRQERDAGVVLINSAHGEGVAQITQIRRALGDDTESKRIVADKVGKENLDWRDTRAVADAYKAADTPELKEAVLNTSGKLGDAGIILERAKMKVAGRAIGDERERQVHRAVQEWDSAVKDFLDAMSMFNKMIRATRKAANYGKFSPEARPFAVRRINAMISELEALREELDNE